MAFVSHHKAVSPSATCLRRSLKMAAANLRIDNFLSGFALKRRKLTLRKEWLFRQRSSEVAMIPITPQLFEAYLKCPTKSFLLSLGETGSGNPYAEWICA